MTPAEKARWFIQHPVALGHAVGFTRLQDYPHGEWLNWMINGTEDGTLQAHRGGYKTSCLEVSIPLLMIRHPQENIIFLRKTDTDVAEVIGAVDRVLKHPVFRQIFHALTGADLQVIKSNSTEITTNIYDAPKGSSQLLGIGIGGSLTGKHADIVITDDIVNLKDRISRAERDRTKAIYQELQNIRNPGGRIINTGTPWHKEDAFSLMPEPMRYDWRQTGMLTEIQAELLKASMAPSLFAANYELVHIASEQALFTTEPKFFKDSNLLRDGIAHIDAAYGGEDYTAFTCGKRIGDKLYLYGKMWHGPADTVLDYCVTRATELMCGPVWCEKNADKGYLAQQIKALGIPAYPYTEKENKYIKISTFLRKWWTQIEWLEGTDQEYLNQILSYTEDAEHDDAPDSAACVCRILDRRGGGDYQSPFR
ncbi:MAG: hypothetical protein J6Y48_07910 [Clostridia bacterium]|nr:hypothetical protein [Clostridia bacterium]